MRCIARLLLLAALLVENQSALAQVVEADGFELMIASPALTSPTAMAFAPDGRIFVAQKDGLVRVVENGNLLAQPFIDLREEVGNAGDRGMLGIALDPAFATNRLVYLLYTVDPTPGQPDEPMQDATFGRLTRYAGTAVSNGAQADTATRTVLLGQSQNTGVPVCWTSHTIGALRFGNDGSLLVSTGDGAKWELADSGGQTSGCLPYLSPGEDIGAFRAQRLDSAGGKILRIQPTNGQGYADNPHYTGNPTDMRSKVWLSGLRNPFRFTVRPSTPAPGTLMISDVGWFEYEELDVIPAAQAGANLGWPCREAFVNAGIYPSQNPSSFGCSTLETPDNPGDLTFPALTCHHNNPSQSMPAGAIGSAIIAGSFATSATYPTPYRGGLLLADFIEGWIDVIQFSPSNQVTAVLPLVSDAAGVVDFAIDPLTGEACFLNILDGRVRRIHGTGGNPADITGDGAVNVDDLLAVINGWGQCGSPCAADVTGDNNVNVDDLLLIINNWG